MKPERVSMKPECIIRTGGSPIYVVPRRDGRPGLLIAQGTGSYVLCSPADLRELYAAIAEALGEPHIQRFPSETAQA